MNFPIKRFAEIDTPFYYYDMSLLRNTIHEIKEMVCTYPYFHIHYAIKANANPQILTYLAKEGLGADCVSGGEVKEACLSGFKTENIVFAGVGKSDKEIREALSLGIFCFNVESLPELEVINELAASMGKVAQVAFRINPNVDAHTHAKITTGLNENKFGIALEDMVPIIKHCQSLHHVQYIGLHFHIGSQILRLDVYRDLCDRINELQDELEKVGLTPRIINVGGGLGINYMHPDTHPIADFATYFSIFAHHLKRRHGQEVHFELGRSIVGQCGVLVARTLYVKEGHEKKFIIVDAGFTDLIRPALYGAYHLIENITRPSLTQLEKYDVVGPICESSDVFSKDIYLPQTKRGDFIVFRSAGAYGEVMASTYNCRQLPKSYFSEI